MFWYCRCWIHKIHFQLFRQFYFPECFVLKSILLRLVLWILKAQLRVASNPWLLQNLSHFCRIQASEAIFYHHNWPVPRRSAFQAKLKKLFSRCSKCKPGNRHRNVVVLAFFLMNRTNRSLFRHQRRRRVMNFCRFQTRKVQKTNIRLAHIL